jgi:glycosyltransferase involved in cell wall biosynthesis
MKIAHLSTFFPIKCGIANFVQDQIAATPEESHLQFPLHYGNPNLCFTEPSANVHDVDELRSLARTISESECDIACIQHEFGIWGGDEGENIHPFLDELNKPVLTVLHTTFGPGIRSVRQESIVLRLLAMSARVVVLTEQAKSNLLQLAGCPLPNVTVVPHGIPSVLFSDPPPLRDPDNQILPLKLISVGFFREDKGHLLILEAMRKLLDEGFLVELKICGETQGQFASQDRYYDAVVSRIKDLKLGDVVKLDTRFLPIEDQIEEITASHAGIFCYQDEFHASSGAVPLVLGVGRPVICTPFEYAQQQNAKGSGVVIAPDFGSNGISWAISELIRRGDVNATSIDAFRRTRSWEWKAVGARLYDEYRLVAA